MVEELVGRIGGGNGSWNGSWGGRDRPSIGDGMLSVEFGELFLELGAADGSLLLELSEVGVGDGSLSLEFGEPVVEPLARDGGLSRPSFVELSCDMSDGKRGIRIGVG